jgi:uncharacterized membrane protein
LAAGAFCALVVAVPLIEQRSATTGWWLRFAFRPTCHQIADRCLDLGSGPLPVCARCAGLYCGGVLGLAAILVAGRRFRPHMRTLAITAAPSVLDFTFGVAGLPSLSNWPRFALAIAPGVVLGLLLADALAGLAGDDVE